MQIFDSSDLGRVLKARRRYHRLTQQQAARLAGVSARLWSELESGKRPQVGLDTALRMAQTIGIDMIAIDRGQASV